MARRHIAMRLTGLQQQTKGLQQERLATGADVVKRWESIKHFLRHGNTPEALEHLTSLFLSLRLLREHSAPAAKVANGLADFEIYIKKQQQVRAHRGAAALLARVPSFGDRRKQGHRVGRELTPSRVSKYPLETLACVYAATKG